MDVWKVGEYFVSRQALPHKTIAVRNNFVPFLIYVATGMREVLT